MLCIKKPKKTISKFVIGVICITSFSMLFSLGGFLKVNNDNVKKNNEMVVNNIYYIGQDLAKTVQNSIGQVFYEIKLYSLSDSLTNMDQTKVAKEMNFIMASRQRYDNILVLNKNKEIVYGYIDESDKFRESEEVNKVFETKAMGVKTVLGDNDYTVDMYNPIIDANKNIMGLIWMRTNLKELNDIMKQNRLNEYSEAYIVNDEGMFLTESRYIPGAVGKQKVDIDRVKLNIDYSRYTPYKNYRNKDVYGSYFTIDKDLGWTLIVEVDKDKMDERMSGDSQKATILTSIQGILLIFIQIILKKVLGINLNLKDIANGDINIDKVEKIIDEAINEEDKDSKEDKDKS